MSKDTLFYDGGCPLCTAEMSKLEKLAGSEMQLVDIHSLPDDARLPPRQVMLERLHLRAANNAMLTGLDANVAAWQHTRIGFLWRWLRWPLVKPCADFVYNRWAARRYRRLYCRAANL